MTGIEQLRKLGSDAVRGGEVGRAICDIADQIERERECERDTIENLRLELGEARDDAAWVREHGGIEGLSRLFQDADSRRVELCTALGIDLGKGWSEAMATMRLRLMPEGYEWPTVDGRKVDFKTSYQPNLGVLEAVSIYNNGAVEVMSHDGIIKPVSEIHTAVLAADGEPLEVGQTVYFPDGTLLHVTGVGNMTEGHQTVFGKAGNDITDDEWDAVLFTHQRPVLDADGVPIKVGDTVWRTSDAREFEVTGIDGAFMIRVKDESMEIGVWTTPCGFTHTKPERDSWERVEEDAGCTATKYNERRGTIFTTKQQVARDLIRRCRALAERERGEA